MPPYDHWCRRHQVAFVVAMFEGRPRTCGGGQLVRRCPTCVEEACLKVAALVAIPKHRSAPARQVPAPLVFMCE